MALSNRSPPEKALCFLYGDQFLSLASEKISCSKYILQSKTFAPEIFFRSLYYIKVERRDTCGTT